MNQLVPAAPAQGSILTPLRDAGAPLPERLKAFSAQPSVRRMLPWFAGAAGLGLVGLTLAMMMPAPQRVLYASLDDADRAAVVAALETGGIDYSIDNGSGALTVGEDDLYRARMLVASDGALAAPQSGTELLDSLPMGASRTMEGDRLRTARERELMLTIAEIDGVQAVRVHLAEADKSVFVRDNIPPSASVMVRMAKGRQLAASQVLAIANLVSASVPGLSLDAVRIIDQHGRLLSQPDGADSDRLELQTRMEAKLRTQLDQLLSPMIGTGNFSSEIQVDLNMDEVTSARESYDKEGAVRRETLQESQGPGAPAGGIPGVLANTPPPAVQAEQGAPEGGPAPGGAGPGGETSSSRTYELGREVAVSNLAPGGVRRLSVAVALSQEAMKGTKPADLARLEELVGAAVGADEQRRDKVAVIVRPFQPAEMEEAPFWETPWFATIVRNGVALLSVLLVLLLGVRPAIKALTGGRNLAKDEADDSEEKGEDAERGLLPPAAAPTPAFSRERLAGEIELAQRIAREQPDDALAALRRMLSETPETEPAR
jgi:flagellar M-ring protein FliF